MQYNNIISRVKPSNKLHSILALPLFILSDTIISQDAVDNKTFPLTSKRTSALEIVSSSSSSSTSNEEEEEDDTDNPVVRANPPNKSGRRPFLQIVVLFAADARVLRYAKEVHNTFLEHGVDSYLQTEETGQHIHYARILLITCRF